MGDGAVILGLVSLTSIVAYVVTATNAGLSARALRDAVGRACEAIGLMLVFLVANAAAWGAVVLAARALTRHSPSFYVLADESLLALSGLQGLVFAGWIGSSRVDGGR